MKIKKMNFENIKGMLSRDEMKKIMAGSGSQCGVVCSDLFSCDLPGGYTGHCHISAANGNCYCVGAH
jgi:hypothetical protein